MRDGLRREKLTFDSHYIKSMHTFTNLYQYPEVKSTLLPENQIIYLMYSLILIGSRLRKSVEIQWVKHTDREAKCHADVLSAQSRPRK